MESTMNLFADAGCVCRWSSDAVQAGFTNVCTVYSSLYIGTLRVRESGWRLAPALGRDRSYVLGM